MNGEPCIHCTATTAQVLRSKLEVSFRVCQHDSVELVLWSVTKSGIGDAAEQPADEHHRSDRGGQVGIRSGEDGHELVDQIVDVQFDILKCVLAAEVRQDAATLP